MKLLVITPIKMLLTSLAFAPCLAICIYIYWKDKFEKESKRGLALSFLLGAFSTIPTVLIESLFPISESIESFDFVYLALYSWLFIALIEEGSKYYFLKSFLPIEYQNLGAPEWLKLMLAMLRSSTCQPNIVPYPPI